MTLLIQAHPEKEYRRLRKAVLDMPISNPDKRERFPKEVSRRLFPQYEDRGIREHVEYAIVKHADIPLPRALNRKEPYGHRGALIHTPNSGRQSCNPQKYGRRRVSFVLLTDIHSDTPRHFEEPTYKDAEKARRQTDEDILSYGERPRRYECAGSKDKRPLKKFDRPGYVNAKDDKILCLVLR